MVNAYEVHREIEIKLDLESFTNYLKLMGFLGQIELEDQHINAFFDTEDRQLTKDGWGLRVRAESARGLVTLKGESTGSGPARVRDEIEAEVRRGEAMDIINLRKDLMSFFIPPIDYVRKKWGDIKLARLVHFENTRQKKAFRLGDYDYILELDKTEFTDGSVDYELELE
ncbi:MAG: CYTH domain-containing protein, partial [Candidatus Zixiibacteriota bacterium]